MIGLVGKKVGMTRIFTEDGVSIPVTVIEVEANRVTQVKDLASDGYRAIQVTTGAKKANRVTKPEAGHFAKAGVEAGAACGSSVWQMVKNSLLVRALALNCLLTLKKLT